MRRRFIVDEAPSLASHFRHRTKFSAYCSRARSTPQSSTDIDANSPASECRLAFYGAGHAGNVVFDEEGVDDGDGDGAQEGASHEGPPEEDVAFDEFGGNADGDGFIFRGVNENKGV